MAGYYETQVRRAMLTVGDTDVLNEMAAGWRSSIPALRDVEDELTAGIRGLRGHDQLGEQTRDAAVAAFGDLRQHLVEQRRLLGRTAQALDAAGEVIGQVKALVRVWDRVGPPRPPGPPPQPSADSDQTSYLAAATLHHRASARHALQVQQREDEAREAWEALNRVFEESEDKIRSAHGIPREDRTGDPQPVWPPHGWPGPPPPEPDPDWPVLPPWPPVRTAGPGPGPGSGGGGGGGVGPGHGPGPVPGVPTAPDPTATHPTPSGGAPQPGHHPPAPGWGHDAPPSTTVAGTPQGGVAYASGPPAGPAGFGAPAGPAGAGMPMPPPLTMPGAGAMSGAAAAGSGLAGGAGARTGAGAGAARAGQAAGASGRGGRSGRTATGAVGGRGSQQAAGRARAGQGGAGRGGAGAGAAGSRGGRRKDRSATSRDDLLGTDDHWLDDEGTAPDVLR